MGDADTSHRRRGTGWLEKLVLFHFGTLLVFTTWAFGGQAPWVRQGIAGWGAGGVLLFIVACLRRHKSTGDQSWPALRYLWPLWLYDVLVLTSCFNPGFKEVVIAGEPSLVMANPNPWLPTAALPWLAWKELWQFNVIVLSCFNLFLVLPGRRFVRGVLFLIGGNAVVLAVFGTFQKLVGASGLWFGLVPSPNARFFSTFIYHNHWGAFVLLSTATCVALLFQAFRRGGQRDIWHSPVLLGAVVTVLLAASVPLSASRSCIVLVGLLLLGALTHFLLRLIRRQRERHASLALPVGGIILSALLAVMAIAYLGRGAIAQRLQQTTAQLAPGTREVTFGSRLTLYHDTWRMASEKPWFGWGLESYAHVFRVFNTQRAAESWLWIPFYAEAHNDWLQSLAEVGFVGTGLLALLVLVPLGAIPWRRVDSVVPRYLLAGCGLVLLYAWLEFPFANPAVMLTFCANFYCALRYAQLDLQGSQERTPAMADAPPVSILILTLNEEKKMPACLASVARFDDVVVLDSGSTDRTAEIARAAGARVFVNPFKDFAQQRNHAHATIAFKHPWVLHLDADEIMMPELAAECATLDPAVPLDGYYIAPRMMFHGNWLRHCTDFPAWQARCVRARGFHFIQTGHGQREAPDMRMGRLAGNYLHDISVDDLAEWEARHQRYARQEAAQFLVTPESLGQTLQKLFAGPQLVRRRALKRLSYYLPARPLMRLFYQYILRGGFLDGAGAWRYCLLLARYEKIATAEIKRQRAAGHG